MFPVIHIKKSADLYYNENIIKKYIIYMKYPQTVHHKVAVEAYINVF